MDLAQRFTHDGLLRGMVGPGARRDPGRFDCMVEINPWTPEHEALSAMLYRGAIVSAWGFIETHLNETAVRCSWHEDYQPLLAKYPRILHERVQYLRDVLDAPGPLHPYRSYGHGLLQRFVDSAALRNTMAHARMEVLPPMGITFREVGRFDGELQQRRRRYQLVELQAMARRATRLSRLCQGVIEAINQRQLLPHHP
ncbi:hypothetical protein [Caulobacter sp. RHG1]|uniref:hypothetical protein n=1 Tax=Caulobacter sp. (strain RHG1) TaxID=2545762 RepID=UPI001554EF3B|nr:hypothetical protein [Caulobacter sp. RHG1]NQE61407.1 hypothetical protein [Caulobacter sp. RHG1]